VERPAAGRPGPRHERTVKATPDGAALGRRGPSPRRVWLASVPARTMDPGDGLEAARLRR